MWGALFDGWFPSHIFITSTHHGRRLTYQMCHTLHSFPSQYDIVSVCLDVESTIEIIVIACTTVNFERRYVFILRCIFRCVRSSREPTGFRTLTFSTSCFFSYFFESVE